jgi:hypothetical protein
MPSQRSQEDETQTFVEREAYTFISTSAASKETRRRQSNAIAGTGTYPPRKNEPAWPRSWIGWFNNLLRTQNSTSFSNQSRLLNGTHYQPVIILTPDDSGYPIYNLDAKLGTQGGNTSIKFQCSASSDGQSRFQLISVEIRLFHLSG